MVAAEGNVWLALGLTLAAGLSTTLGACIVFCASLAQNRLLAVSLGFAAGVMLYISFAEIFMRKSVQGFEAVQLDANAALRYSTLCFFGGMGVIAVLDKIVHVMADWAGRRAARKALTATSTANLLSQSQLASDEPTELAHPRGSDSAGGSSAAVAPAQQLLQVDGASARSAAISQPAGGAGDLEAVGGEDAAEGPALVPDVDVPKDALQVAAVQEQAAHSGTTSRQAPTVVEIMKTDNHNWALKKMGLLTGVAIFIHNFPEGLATFVGALADTSIGVGIAVAIAVHNIPEGICVAMPIYYATGSKMKGFVWAFLSGISEPLGGLVGLLVLQGNTDLGFAIVFGLVAGMMVYISVKELLPTALKYDPDDKWTTTSAICGMAVMAVSLLLFTL